MKTTSRMKMNKKLEWPKFLFRPSTASSVVKKFSQYLKLVIGWQFQDLGIELGSSEPKGPFKYYAIEFEPPQDPLPPYHTKSYFGSPPSPALCRITLILQKCSKNISVLVSHVTSKRVKWVLRNVKMLQLCSYSILIGKV